MDINKLKTILIAMLLLINLIGCIDQVKQTSDFQLTENQMIAKQSKQKQSSSTNESKGNENFYQNSQNQSYKRIYNSTEYYRQFSSQLSKISLSQTVNVTHLSNGKQLCLDSLPCQFFYYVIKPKFDPQSVSSFSMNANNNVKNVLFVSGMHGNQYLGPMSLLYAIKHLETPSTRIIIFPLANPSGFDHNKRQTFPTNLDPNRDFPIQQYHKCYQTTSSLIIDHIYRKYHIDLTLAVHNGRSQIGWNWGTMRQQYNSRTVDQVIYKDIGEWLKFAGGKNKDISMEQFKIGTMNEVIYPVKGGFQDWAYAASWYNASEGKKPTKSCPFSQYPFNMTNGLVFLFQLGPFNVDEKLFGSQEGLYINPSTRHQSNGYISRAIRMFKGLMKIPNPRLELRFTNQKAVVNLLGCKNGVIDRLKISNKQNLSQIYYESRQKLSIQGNINNKSIQSTILSLQKEFFPLTEMKNNKFNKLQARDLIVEYNLLCDLQWKGRGNTIFGQKRQFYIKQTLLLSPTSTPYAPQTLFPTTAQAQSYSHNFNTNLNQDQQSFFDKVFGQNNETLMIIIILILVIATLFFVVWVVFREIRKDMKARRIQRLKRKLQKISQDSSIQEIGPYNSTEITLTDVKMNQQGKNGNDKKSKKSVQSYPHMCESDKSMKTEELDSSRDHNI